MKLEDALLYLVIDLVSDEHRDIGSLCQQAIAGGVDLVELRPSGSSDSIRKQVASAVDACRQEDALCIVTDNVALATETGASGVLINDPGLAFGTVRAGLNPLQLVGVSTKTLDEAMLALEMGPDYVTHYAGPECLGHFGSLKFIAGVPLYAAGLSDFSEAESLTSGGILRLCVHMDTVDSGGLTGTMAEFSRLLGRSI